MLKGLYVTFGNYNGNKFINDLCNKLSKLKKDYIPTFNSLDDKLKRKLIITIIESQSLATIDAIANKEDVAWYKLGRFIIKENRQYALNRKMELKKEGVDEDEANQIIYKELGEKNKAKREYKKTHVKEVLYLDINKIIKNGKQSN